MLQPPSLVVLSYSYVARQKQATVRRGTAAEVLAPLNTPPSPSSFPLLIVSGLHVIPRDGFKPSGASDYYYKKKDEDEYFS